jgi:Tfp pilus assembly protein PilW
LTTLPAIDSKISASAGRRRNASGFTLAEALVAIAIGMSVVTGAMFLNIFALKGVSASTSQTQQNLMAGTALELIEGRVRLATMVSNDAAGNTLTLAFDTNTLVDSSNGVSGIPWANWDRFEQFKFVGTNTTNTTGCASNELVWIPNVAQPDEQEILIPTGVRNLPGHNIFSVTNTVLATICFGIVDINPQDYYNGIEIQAMAASLNRPQVNNMIRILAAP